MTVDIECQYCGKKWRKVVYNKQSLDMESCSVCKGRRLRIKDHDTSSIDYYAGSPPFPEKASLKTNQTVLDPNDDNPWGMGGFEYMGND